MAAFYTDSEANALGLYGPDQTPNYSNPMTNDFTSSGIPSFSSGSFSPNSTTPGGVPTNSQGQPTVSIGGGSTSSGSGSSSSSLFAGGGGGTSAPSSGSSSGISIFSGAYWNDILIRGGLILLAVILIGAGIYLLGKEVVNDTGNAAGGTLKKAAKGLAVA